MDDEAYKILGIRKHASQEDIDKAYSILMKRNKEEQFKNDEKRKSLISAYNKLNNNYNTIHPYRIGVWDGFYSNEPRDNKFKGIDSLVPNYLYNLGYSFGDFLKQTDKEWKENV